MPELAEHITSRALGNLVVFDCNWLALEVFLASCTQWRLRPSGEIQALDYTSLGAVMEMMNIPPKDRPDVFKRVRLIESGALPALTKLRESRSK